MSRRRAKSISLEDCASATGPGPMAQFFFWGGLAGMAIYWRPLKKACAKSAWRMAGHAVHRRMRRVSGRRGLPGQQLEVVCRSSHGELLGCSGEASQLKRS